MHERFIARQPIFNQRLKVYAYELLFRSGPQNFFQAQAEASCSVIVDSTMVFDLEALTGPAKAFVNVTMDALLRGAPRILPPNRIVVEILESIEPTAEVIRSCEELRRDGYVLALDDFVGDLKWEPLIPLAKILKVDFLALDSAARRAVACRYLPRGLELLAEKVETQADVEEARHLGYTSFQGFFFCKPQMIQSKDIPASQLTCLRLLKAIAGEDINFDEVEELLKQEPGLVYKLLRYLNSPLMGFRNEVHGVRDALVLLGETGFRRWISIVALVSMVGDKPPELIHTALLRAYCCERISELIGESRHHSDFFLMGLLSVVDVLLDRSMEEVLGHLALAEDIRSALCGGENLVRGVYDLVLAYERADWPAMSSAAARIGMSEDQVPECYLSATKQSLLITM